MIQVIVFSFNRAMQLDTLLSSFFKHWKSPSYKIDVIYNYSSKVFGDGYNIIEKTYHTKVAFHREKTDIPDRLCFRNLLCVDNLIRLYRQPKLRKPQTNFRSLLIKIIKQSEADDVMFLTDDSMFVNDVTIQEFILTWINKDANNRQFSLRLGKGDDLLPKTVIEDGNYCSWDMYQNNHSWGYPFSVDAHIYNKGFVYKLLSKYLFINPNTLESHIVNSVRRRKQLSEAKCFKEIKMLTFPINIVQSSINNLSQNVSVDMLNERYLRGERLKYKVEGMINSVKFYPSELIFVDNEGKEKYVRISSELIRNF